MQHLMQQKITIFIFELIKIGENTRGEMTIIKQNPFFFWNGPVINCEVTIKKKHGSGTVNPKV